MKPLFSSYSQNPDTPTTPCRVYRTIVRNTEFWRQKLTRKMILTIFVYCIIRLTMPCRSLQKCWAPRTTLANMFPQVQFRVLRDGYGGQWQIVTILCKFGKVGNVDAWYFFTSKVKVLVSLKAFSSI